MVSFPIQLYIFFKDDLFILSLYGKMFASENVVNLNSSLQQMENNID